MPFYMTDCQLIFQGIRWSPEISVKDPGEEGGREEEKKGQAPFFLVATVVFSFPDLFIHSFPFLPLLNYNLITFCLFFENIIHAYFILYYHGTAPDFQRTSSIGQTSLTHIMFTRSCYLKPATYPNSKSLVQEGILAFQEDWVRVVWHIMWLQLVEELGTKKSILHK